jgi:hypothetical protein
MDWFYGKAGALLAVVLFLLVTITVVLYITLAVLHAAPVVPVHHNVIHSGIGNALCTPSYICEKDF